MWTSPWILVALLATGCAASRPALRPEDKQLASAEQCGRLADHLFTIEVHGNSAGKEEHLLDPAWPVAFYGLQLRYQDFVSTCQSELRHVDAECLLEAPSAQYIDACQIELGYGGSVPRHADVNGFER